MAFVNNTTCDKCGAIKGEGNRWLCGWESVHGYALADWPDVEQVSRIGTTVNTFCGENCALSHQAQYLRRV